MGLLGVMRLEGDRGCHCSTEPSLSTWWMLCNQWRWSAPISRVSTQSSQQINSHWFIEIYFRKENSWQKDKYQNWQDINPAGERPARLLKIWFLSHWGRNGMGLLIRYTNPNAYIQKSYRKETLQEFDYAFLIWSLSNNTPCCITESLRV